MTLASPILTVMLILTFSTTFSQSYTLDAAAEKRWHIKEVLTDKNTMQLAKDISQNKDWELSADNTNLLLRIVDSLPHMNANVKGFYFMVIARSFDKADGPYAESLGYSGKAYVDSNLVEFLNYFTGDGKLPDIYLQKWSAIVANQFEAIKVDQNPKVLIKLSKYYDALCKGCRSQQKSVLKEYEDLIKTYVK